MFYLNSTLNFGIPPVLVFQSEVYYNVDRLLNGLTAQQKGTALLDGIQMKHLYICNFVAFCLAVRPVTKVYLPYSRLLTGIPKLSVFQNLRWNSNKTSLAFFFD